MEQHTYRDSWHCHVITWKGRVANFQFLGCEIRTCRVWWLVFLIFFPFKFRRRNFLSVCVCIPAVAHVVCDQLISYRNTRWWLVFHHYLKRKYLLSSFNLLGHTTPIQAGSLLLVGPFLDYWLTEKRVNMFKYDISSMVSKSIFIQL